MTPKRPLIEYKRILFLKNRHILTLNRITFSLKKQPFRVSLGEHVYNTIIRVPPPPRVYSQAILLLEAPM